MIWLVRVGRYHSLLSCSSARRRSLKQRCVAGFSMTRAYLMSWWKLTHRGDCLGTGIPTRTPPMPSPLPSPRSCDDGCRCRPRQVMFLALIANLFLQRLRYIGLDEAPLQKCQKWVISRSPLWTLCRAHASPCRGIWFVSVMSFLILACLFVRTQSVMDALL